MSVMVQYSAKFHYCQHISNGHSQCSIFQQRWFISLNKADLGDWLTWYRRNNSVPSEAVIKGIAASTLGSWIALGREASHLVLRTFNKPYWEAQIEKNWGLLLTRANSSASWLSHLESEYASPNKSFKWLQANWHIDHNLLTEQAPEPRSGATLEFLSRRNCEIIKVFLF